MSTKNQIKPQIIKIEMINNKLISVIIPVYKVENYIDDCVKTIVEQTYKNLEIILVDDGSPDNCPKMCDEWATRDRRIKVVHKKNGGLSSARNAGMKVATGDYIGFVDSDDWIEKDMYEKLLDGFKSSSSIGITSCMVYSSLEGKASPYNSNWIISDSKNIGYNDFAIEMITQRSCYTVWNKLYSADLAKSVLFKEGRNNEDTLYMYDLSKVLTKEKKNLLELPFYGYYYRKRADSITTSARKPLEIDTLANYQDLMSDCKKSNQRLYDALFYMYVKLLYQFLDAMMLNSSWKHQYFSKYRAMLRKMPTSYIRRHFALNDALYIEMLKYLPTLRKYIRLTLNHLRK